MNEKQNLKRIMEPYPQDSFVIPGSTPVVSFGDPSKASVVTIGINPSSREFGNKTRLFKPGMKLQVLILELQTNPADMAP